MYLHKPLFSISVLFCFSETRLLYGTLAVLKQLHLYTRLVSNTEISTLIQSAGIKGTCHYLLLLSQFLK